jgi:benzoylformate decarboxylase
MAGAFGGEAEDVPTAIARAYYTSMQKPCGPTFVSIPIDDWNVAAQMPRLRTVSRDVAPDPGAPRTRGGG